MDAKTDEARREYVESKLFELRQPGGQVENVIKLYDDWKDHYEEDLLAVGHRFDKHLDEFEDFVQIKKDAKILDLAAGTGMIGQKLTERGFTNIDALDGSAGMLEHAKKRGVYKNLIEAIVTPQPLEGVGKDTYDLVICGGSLTVSHIRYESFETLVAITKPGCYIYFITALEFLRDQKHLFEARMRKLHDEGIWRWVLMKESPHPQYKKGPAMIYAFLVL